MRGSTHFKDIVSAPLAQYLSGHKKTPLASTILQTSLSHGMKDVIAEAYAMKSPNNIQRPSEAMGKKEEENYGFWLASACCGTAKLKNIDHRHSDFEKVIM